MDRQENDKKMDRILQSLRDFKIPDDDAGLQAIQSLVNATATGGPPRAAEPPAAKSSPVSKSKMKNPWRAPAGDDSREDLAANEMADAMEAELPRNSTSVFDAHGKEHDVWNMMRSPIMRKHIVGHLSR